MAEYVCPHCKQLIYDDDALLCHFCGESLERTSSGALGKIKDPKTKWFYVIVVLLVIVSFVILFSL